MPAPRRTEQSSSASASLAATPTGSVVHLGYPNEREVHEHDAAAQPGGPSGSELSRPVAPANEGNAPVRTRSSLAKRAEPRAQLGGVQLRLLPGGEVPARSTSL